VTVTSGRSNFKGALHSTSLRGSYYLDATIVRSKAGDIARFGRIDRINVSAPIGSELRAQGYHLREARTPRRSGVANRSPSAIDAKPIAE
jgi:hypothetical protein